MKKILVAIALVVVMATLLMLPAVGASGSGLSVEKLIKWNALGDDLHYVGSPVTTPPKQDGSIKEGEYTYSFRLTDPIYPCDSYTSLKKIGYNPDMDYSSNYVDYYAAYDEDYIYIAIYDDQHKNAGSDINFYIRFGIDANDVNELIGPPQLLNRPNKEITEFYKGDTSGKDLRYEDVNGKQIITVDKTYCLSTIDATGSFDSVYEFRFDRDSLTEIFNANKGTGFLENPDVFMFTTYMMQYGKGSGDVYTYYRWCGKELSNVERLNLGLRDVDFIPAVFVLGEEGCDFLGNGDLEIPTKPAETEAPTTEPETEAPTTEPATEAPETQPVTEAPTTEPTTEAPDPDGCGSSVTAMGIALVAALGTCAVVVSRKKED